MMVKSHFSPRLSPGARLFLPVDDSFGMEELQPHYYLR